MSSIIIPPTETEPPVRKRFTSSSLIFFGDCIVVAICMVTAFYLRYVLDIGVVGDSARPGVLAYLLHYSAGFALFFLLAENQGLYDSSVTAFADRSTTRLVKISLFWAVMFLGSSLILKLNPPISRLFVGYSCALMCLLLPLWRVAYLRLARRFGLDKELTRRVAVIGCTSENHAFVGKLTAKLNDPYVIVGLVTRAATDEKELFGIPVIGSLEDIEKVFQDYDIDEVAVADADLSHEKILRIAKACERGFVEFNLVPGQFEVFTRCLGLKMIGTQPVLGVAELPQNHVLSRTVKRVVDIVGSVVGLMITLPMVPIIGFLIWRESPGPIIYKQIRTGRGGRPFTIYKFRSMKLSSEADGQARWCSEDDPRRLRIGEFLRKWNIDELPQFWNVLKGDMSLVGPRPERPELIVDFLNEIPHYQSRHSVRPGMTGWAQVNGLRGNTSLEERIRHDLQYIENWSLWLDVVIQVRTLFQYKNAY